MSIEFDKQSAIENAKAYVKSFFEGEASGHDFWHTMRVLRLAETIAISEGADLFTVRLAALLHDVDDVKLSPTTSAGLDNAIAFMRENSVDNETTEKVCRIIRDISFKGRDSVVPDSLEGKCVQDADRLDALGAIGVARTFAYGGSRGRAMYDPEHKPNADMSAEEYRQSNSSSIAHFYEKLFLLKDMMNTEKGKAIALERDAFMHEFVSRFLNEWDGGK